MNIYGIDENLIFLSSKSGSSIYKIKEAEIVKLSDYPYMKRYTNGIFEYENEKGEPFFVDSNGSNVDGVDSVNIE